MARKFEKEIANSMFAKLKFMKYDAEKESILTNITQTL
jgi:hypothetical protein